MTDVTNIEKGKCGLCGTLLSRELSGGGWYCSVGHRTRHEQGQEIESLKAELEEQCRLHGMGASREAKLMAERDRHAEHAAHMEVERDESRLALKSKQAYVDSLNEDIDNLQRELAEMRANRNQLGTENVRLNAEVERLKIDMVSGAEYEKVFAERHSLRNEATRLRAMLERARVWAEANIAPLLVADLAFLYEIDAPAPASDPQRELDLLWGDVALTQSKIADLQKGLIGMWVRQQIDAPAPATDAGQQEARRPHD